MSNEQLTFEALEDPPGVRVVDQLERLRYRLDVPEPVSPTRIDPGTFHFPVGSAISVTTDSLALPTVVSVFVRDGDGKMVTEVEHLDEKSLGPGAYILELSTQIKTYIEVEGPFEVTTDILETRIDFAEPTTVRIGARSRHERPAATVTTTDDPVDMMAAVSTFGSALKSTTPERSYPSLRGHPPAIELGDSLEIPDAIQPPETGIQIELPPKREYVYVAAPLAYYLGAEVVPGSTPRLTTETGFEYALDPPGGTVGYEKRVEHTLKQLFVLDCITRTEGLYDVDLHERNELERHVDLDFETLYDQPLAEQVATYLDIPYAVVADQVPEWRLTVHVEPKRETVEQLPFVVDDLAVVRTVGDTSPYQSVSQPEPSGTVGDDVLTRSAANSTGTTDDETLARSTTDSPGKTDNAYVEPQSTDSLEQAWIGDRIPIGASKLTTEAFHNRLDREVSEGDISITVVLNDDRMSEERDLVDRVYGDRENLPFDVRVHRDLTAAELREVLRVESSFFHYIGHTERDGFVCADGKLDAATLEETGVESFLLNACNSYEQGLRLIEAGSIGGIVTLNDIISDRAVDMGETLARLLNAGFPLRAALTVAREESILGGQYIVVGDGGMSVTQAPSRTPTLLELSEVEDGFSMEIRTYPTDDAGLGTIYIPHLDGQKEYFITSGTIGSFQVTKDELDDYLKLENFPIKTEESLRWSRDTDLSEIDGL